MKKLLKIKLAAAALNQTPLDWSGNKERIIAAIDQAKKEKVSVLCLPELCLSGYGCEDAFMSEGVAETSLEILKEILPKTENIVVSLGLPVRVGEIVYNASALICDAKLIGIVGKLHLAGYGIHYEPRWFRPWPKGEITEIDFLGKKIPFGDLFFDISGLKVGIEICQDAWVEDRRAKSLAESCVQLILNNSTSHFAFEKYKIRKDLVKSAAEKYSLAYVYANMLGNESGRIIYDGSALIASGSEIIAEGPRFSFRDVVLTSAVVEILESKPVGNNSGLSKVEAEFLFPEIADSRETVSNEISWEEGECLKEEEFSRAVTLGLFDYLRKSKSNGFVLSLSGGADSAGIACLVRLMSEFAISELGVEGFKNKLSHIKSLSEHSETQDLMNQILLCVYQGTKNSSETTLEAAETISQALGANFYRLDIDHIVENYISLIEVAIGRELTWEGDDISLQNIQARTRAPGVWLLANLRNALLLATSNRSEAAVGYTTMDGDTSGSISPIAGIDKAFLLSWLSWLERVGPSGFDLISELSVITQQKPTAELRPEELLQTDESDLMPYTVLDYIERLAIRDKLMPKDILPQLEKEFSASFSKQQLKKWTIRFFRLWSRNQWKRERYAPSFHLDDENLDPKTWCRFPILSGGFERELAEL